MSTPTPPSASAVAMGSGIGNAQKSVAQGFAKFRNNRLVSGAANFLYSNSLVAKVVFLILVVILFVFLLRIGIQIANWLFTPSKTPFLLNGLKSAKKGLTISQDPRDRDSIPLERSKNQRDGITFTYSVWMMIERINAGKKRHVFHKGSSHFEKEKMINGFQYSTENNLPYPNMAPGLFIDENNNTLHVYCNTFNKLVEHVTVSNIPMNKWFNVIIRVKNLNLDVFINGNVAVRHRLSSPVKQNYEDIHVNKFDGYDGFISSLRYWNYALSSPEIMDVNRSGPNLKAQDQQDGFPPYLSLRWYFKDSE